MHETHILTRAQIARCLDPATMMAALRQAFAEYSVMRKAPARRFPVNLPEPAPAGASAMILVPGLIESIPAYSVKVHAKIPGHDPAIQGVIILHDIETGHPLAILESTLITALRTGLAGAIGADILARPNARIASIIGAGAQGILQLECLALVRQLDQVRVFDTNLGRAAKFAQRESSRLGIPIRPVEMLEEAVRDADIIVASTWAREPFLFMPMLKPGVHITTLGPDQPGKCEVDASIIREGVFACDDRDLAVEMGAIAGAGLGPEAIDAELGEIIAGVKPGRTTLDQVTVFGSVGLAFQDLVLAWAVYRAESEKRSSTVITLRD